MSPASVATLRSRVTCAREARLSGRVRDSVELVAARADVCAVGPDGVGPLPDTGSGLPETRVAVVAVSDRSELRVDACLKGRRSAGAALDRTLRGAAAVG